MRTLSRNQKLANSPDVCESVASPAKRKLLQTLS
jgi:hypothetical protein